MLRLERDAGIKNDSIDPISGHILGQYTAVVGRLDTMFSVISARTNGELWKETNSRYAGVGGCTISGKVSERQIFGRAKDDLIKLRERKNEQSPGEKNFLWCPYHRIDKGCVLGELKSPLCISHIDYPIELERRFNIDGYRLTKDINWVLARILSGNTDPFLYNNPHPEMNDEFTKDACWAIEQMTGYLKRFPLVTTISSFVQNYSKQ